MYSTKIIQKSQDYSPEPIHIKSPLPLSTSPCSNGYYTKAQHDGICTIPDQPPPYLQSPSVHVTLAKQYDNKWWGDTNPEEIPHHIFCIISKMPTPKKSKTVLQRGQWQAVTALQVRLTQHSKPSGSQPEMAALH